MKAHVQAVHLYVRQYVASRIALPVRLLAARPMRFVACRLVALDPSPVHLLRQIPPIRPISERMFHQTPIRSVCLPLFQSPNYALILTLFV